MPRLLFREAAVADLRAIHAFIAADDPPAARRVVQEIRTRCLLLADHLGAGPGRPDLGPGMRLLPLPGRVVVAYRVTQAVEVVRIFYGGQDHETLLRAQYDG
jgi:toxin ParE1/3/4